MGRLLPDCTVFCVCNTANDIFLGGLASDSHNSTARTFDKDGIINLQFAEGLLFIKGLVSLFFWDHDPKNGVRDQTRKSAREQKNKEQKTEPECADSEKSSQATANTGNDPVTS